MLVLKRVTESLEVEDSRDSNKKKRFIQDYISWGWDVTEGKQPWKPATDNKLAYLSSMCRDKSASAEAPFLSDSVGMNIYKTLLGSDIPIEHVALKDTTLSKTAPFGQVSRLQSIQPERPFTIINHSLELVHFHPLETRISKKPTK